MHNVEPSPFWRESAFKQREVLQTIVRSFTLSHERTAQLSCDPAIVPPLLLHAPHVRGNRVQALQLMRTFLSCQKISKFTARTIMQ